MLYYIIYYITICYIILYYIVLYCIIVFYYIIYFFNYIYIYCNDCIILVCQYPWLRSCTTLKQTTHRPGCGTAAQEHVAEFNQWTARRTGRQVVQCDTGMPPRHPTWRVTPKVAESTKAYCSKLAPQNCMENLSFTSCHGGTCETLRNCSRRFSVETSADGQLQLDQSSDTTSPFSFLVA